MKRMTLLAALVITPMLCQPRSASAESTLAIQLNGLRLVYNGSEIFDADNVIGGVANPAEATPLTSVTFLQNGMTVGTLNAAVFADVDIVGASGIPVGGGTVAFGQGSIFDILTSATDPASGLSLDFGISDPFSIVYNPSTNSISGQATTSALFFQDLPFGLAFEPGRPFTLSFQATLTSSTNNGTSLTGFVASGSGSITGQAIPEPSSIALVAVGSGLVVLLRRRRRSGE